MAKRKPKKPKLKSIAQIVEEAAVLLQKLVRLKAQVGGYCKCVSCGTLRHWKELQGGHFISRKWTATKLLEENVHPQCRNCNGPLRGNMIAYTLYMEDTYGRGFVEELQRLKHETKKYTRQEIAEITAGFKQRIEELERVIGG